MRFMKFLRFLKDNIIEILVLALNTAYFFIVPFVFVSISPTTTLLLPMLLTFICSLFVGAFFPSEKNQKPSTKWFYPFVIAITFVPSVFFMLNGSALIYSLWHLLISMGGVSIGSLVKAFLKNIS